MFPLGSAVNRLDDLKLIDNNGDLKDFYGFELSLDSISPTTIVCETKDIQEALRIFHQWLDKRGFLNHLKDPSE